MNKLWKLLLLFLLWTSVGFVDIPRAEAQDDFLITSFSGSSVERFDAATGQSLGSFIAASSGGLTNAAGVAVGPDSNLYVTSWGTNQILRYNGETGAFIDIFASGNGLLRPNNILLHDGNFFVTQTATGSSGTVRRYDAVTGDFIDNFLDIDTGDGLIFDTNSNSILVSNFGGGVDRFDLNDGSFIESFIGAGEGGLVNPTALLLQDDGSLLVSSFGTNSVKRFDANGDFVEDVITGITQPEGLAIGPDGLLYAGSFGSGLVNRYDATSFEFVDEFVNIGGNTNFFIFRTTAVPEPGSAIILLMSSGFFLRRSRK